jgi:carbon monoxide dehydrogenase subunit G
MQLKGKQVLNATPSIVWAKLMDTDTLAKVIPGVTTLEKVSENSFTSTLQIKLGPVNGSFSGNLQLEDITDQKNFTLKVQQNSKIGNTNAAIKVDLTPVNDNQTEVAFDGDAKLSGLLAGMGQRVIGGVANTLTKQFFANLEKELAPTAPETV